MKLTTLQIETLQLIEAGKVTQRNAGHGAWRIFGAHPTVVGKLVALKLAAWSTSYEKERSIALTPEGADALSLAYPSQPTAPSVTQSSFQTGVYDWLMACFGAEVACNKTERADRYVEETLELLQSVDYPVERIIALIGYVFGREKGEPKQEAGGVLVTLASFYTFHGIDMTKAGDAELARVWTKIDAIRAKQAAKPTGSALPVAVPPLTVDRQEALDFIGIATRNWSDMATLEEDDIGDVATALLQFVQQKSKIAALLKTGGAA